MSDWPFFLGMAWRANLSNALPGNAPIGHSGAWFRIFGYGLHVSTKKRADALFSERNGFRRALYLFGLRFAVLTA